MAEFYIICQPGFEKELQIELQEIWPFLIESDGLAHHHPLVIKATTIGGLLIEAPTILGYQINLFSKVASRVLQRITEFKVRDFPKLFQMLKKLNIPELSPTQKFRVEVDASQSRLNNEKRILQVAQDAFKNIDEKADLALLIRIHDDTCTVSLDTSGPHLHFRRDQKTIPKKISEAPIRETCAAFMVRRMMDSSSADELQSVTLVDPMAGSGTLLAEAGLLFQGNFARSYSYLNFQNCPKILKSPQLSGNYPTAPSLFFKLIANDINPKCEAILQENLAQLGPNKNQVEIHCRDFKDLLPLVNSLPGQQRVWLICNPPYGDRIKSNYSFVEMAEIFAKQSAEKIGILLPKGQGAQFEKGLAQFKLTQKNFFKNGGIPVEFLVFEH